MNASDMFSRSDIAVGEKLQMPASAGHCKDLYGVSVLKEVLLCHYLKKQQLLADKTAAVQSIFQFLALFFFSLARPLGTPAQRAIYFACVNFFIFSPRASTVYAVVVCLSVRLSVTLRYCIKTAKRKITQITTHDRPMTLVF